MICAACGAESAAGMRFCGHCGARLEAEHQMPERRQLTVLFCDIVGSTSLAEALDPEEYSAVLSSFQHDVRAAVEGHGGHIAQLLGDGVLAYFGYPIAHENGPDLAVAAGLGVLSRLEQRRAREGSEPAVRVRIGMHTGPVVIDPQTDVRERRNLALGNTPNVAARLQQLAEPDTVLLSEDTRRLLHTEPDLRDLGRHTLKGLRRPVRVYRVVAADPAQNEPTGARRFSPSPMVNREQELAALARCWSRAREGHGCAGLVEGEAGVGKSRVVRHFVNQLDAGTDVMVAHCSALRTSSALDPVQQMLRATLDLTADTGLDVQRRSLDEERARLGLDPELLPGLASALRLPIDDPFFAAAAPELRRRQTHAALHAWLRARARQGPVVLVVEDLHWVDPSTLEWLGTLLDDLEHHPLLVLMTGRPSAAVTVPRTKIQTIDVSGLSAQHADALIRGVAGDDEISARWRERLLAETDGVPLYLEELTRGVLEARDDRDDLAAGSDDRGELGIPSSLQALLTARLDRLQTSKPLAQWAAVLGRTFSLTLLRAVAARLPTDFDDLFDALLHAGILEAETTVGRRYRFRHALFQEAAYRSLLRIERRDRHRAVAEVLVAGGPGIVANADEIAHHFTEAGQARQAAHWWQQAGDEALARSENTESVAFLRRGLAVVASLDPNESEALALRLEGSLATALTAVKGYAAAEVEALHGSVQTRARHLGDSREIFSSLRHTLPFYLVRGQHEKARAIGEELVDMASRLDAPSLLLEAHLALATPCFWLGEAAISRDNALAALAHYDAERHAGHAVEFGQDPGTLCHLYAAWSLWWLGAFGDARRHLDEAMILARAREHPHSLAMALDHGCSLHLYFHEWRAARALATEQLAIAQRFGFSMWTAMGGFRLAWLDCLDGDLASGIARMQGALRAFRATGAEIARPLHLSYLAEAHRLAGDIAAGRAVVAEALQSSIANQENHYVVELHRLDGELALDDEGAATAAAEAAFRQALDVARVQGAKALELRTALSAYRAARGEGRAGATADLRHIVDALGDEHDAPDLVAARAALGEP